MFPYRNLEACAAGIIPCNNEGMWLILEKQKNKKVLTDLGKRCIPSDRKITRTAVRSMAEESLFTFEVTNRHFEYLLSTGKVDHFYVGNREDPKYISYWVDVEDLGKSRPDLFDSKRNFELENGRKVNAEKLIFVRYEELFNYTLSWRLQKILKNAIRFGVIEELDIFRNVIHRAIISKQSDHNNHTTQVDPTSKNDS